MFFMYVSVVSICLLLSSTLLYESMLIHLLVDRHLGCFQLADIMNKVPSTFVYVFFVF